MKIKISIIIPIYNTYKYISRCLDSIYNQRLKNTLFEVILIDDASKKESINKIYKQKYENIKIIRNKKNIGPGLTRNVGIENATGNYLLFLDSDDHLSKNSINLLIKHLRKNDSDICFYDHIEINELAKTKKQKKIQNKNYVLKNKKKIIIDFISASIDSSVIFSTFKRSFILKNRIKFNPGLHEDILFLFKSYFFSSKKSYLKKLIYFKRNRKGSIINSINEARIKDYFYAFNSIYKFLLKKNYFKNNERIYKYLYKGQTGYIYEMIIAIIKSQLSIRKKINLLKISNIFVKKNFNSEFFPFFTKKDKITSYFINNIDNIISLNEFKKFIVNIENIHKCPIQKKK